MRVSQHSIDLDQAEVLVVEDEQPLADLYRTWLSPDLSVSTVHTAAAAVGQLDDTVDVTILDRRLPNGSGQQVLDHIQAERLDCMVVIVSAVNPECDIANFPIDEYLVKPISREGLRSTIDDLLLRSMVDLTRQELLALLSRKLVLENEYETEVLEEAEEYQELLRKIDLLESELDVAPQNISSRHRPDSCPDCGLCWNLDLEGRVGFVVMAARVWKCIECGRVVHKPDPSNRSVARGR